MPYAEDTAGIYRIVDTSTGHCYVGQSRRLRKRIAEHFRLLRKGLHPNAHLQQAFSSNPSTFTHEIEVRCDDPNDMDAIEEAFLTGEAKFDESPSLFNVSSTARTPMQGRSHTDETREQISKSKRGRRDHVTSAYRAKLSAAQRTRALSDPEYLARVKFIVQNPHLSYAERGRRVGIDTSTARKLALKYAHQKEIFDG